MPIRAVAVWNRGTCSRTGNREEEWAASPDRNAGVVTIRCELVGPSSTFRPGVVAGALEHQVGDAPNVDLAYHAGKARPGMSINV